MSSHLRRAISSDFARVPIHGASSAIHAVFTVGRCLWLATTAAIVNLDIVRHNESSRSNRQRPSGDFPEQVGEHGRDQPEEQPEDQSGNGTHHRISDRRDQRTGVVIRPVGNPPKHRADKCSSSHSDEHASADDSIDGASLRILRATPRATRSVERHRGVSACGTCPCLIRRHLHPSFSLGRRSTGAPPRRTLKLYLTRTGLPPQPTRIRS
jgi:hypothetical protein